MTRDSTDRREHARAPLRSPVLVDAMSTWHQARCENVSAGGVSIACQGPLPPLPLGKTVELYFELPSGVAVEVHARVVRAGATHVALQFLDLDHGAEVALRAHCHMASLTR